MLVAPALLLNQKPTTKYVGLLDALGISATAAVSFRLLRSAYTGKSMNVRRSSDNSTMDIGFVGGNFDSMTYSTFIGGGSGFVTKWYDQSGNGNDVSQTTAANQPQLLLNQQNGRAGIKFTGGSTTYLTGSGAGSAQPLSISAVINRTVIATSSFYVFGAINGSGVPEFGFSNVSNTINLGITNVAAFAATASDNAAHVAQGLWNGSSSEIVVDGTATTGTIGTNAAGSARTIGSSSFGGNFYFTGLLFEIIEFDSDSSAQFAAMRSNQKAYFGTP